MATHHRSRRALNHTHAPRHARAATQQAPEAAPLLVGIDEPSAAHGVLRVAALLARRARTQVRATEPHAATAAMAGDLATVVISAARRQAPYLILLPLGKLGALTRDAYADTVIRVSSTVDVPVLAVPPDQKALPARAVVATDFSAESMRAAKALFRILGRGSVMVVHVEPEPAPPAPSDEIDDVAGQGAARLLRQFVADVEAYAKQVVPGKAKFAMNGAVVCGDRVDALLEFAAGVQADLLVLGVGPRAMDDASCEKVTRSVLRRAATAVLVARTSE